MALSDRLDAISAVTERRLANLDVDELLAELLERVARVLDADTAAVLLLDESGRYLVARAAHGIEEEVRQGVRVPLGRGFAGRIAVQRQAVRLDQVDPTTVQNPILWQKGIQSMVGVPLEHGTQLLGVLHVGAMSQRAFSEADVQLLELVAERATAAIQVWALDLERSASRLVQRSLLPAALPQCPGVEFATRYVPSGAGSVGGDWYDAFVLPNGELWVFVGDVAGHGLQAAVTMGRLRAALRAYSLEGHPPDQVLRLADAKLQLFDPGETVTVLCGRLRPPYATMELSSAGHLPPVVVAPGHGPKLVQLAQAVPLGVTPGIGTQTTEVEIVPGAVFVAYTDGLVERRDESLDVGIRRLLQATTAQHPDTVCQSIMQQLIGTFVPGDDVALLALQRLPDLPS